LTIEHVVLGHVAEVNYTFYCCCCHGIISVSRRLASTLVLVLALRIPQNILIVYTTLSVESNYIHVLLINDCLYMDVPIGPVRVGLCECLGCPTY